MGNSLHVVLDNYIGTAPIPCHLQLGATTSIDLSRDLSEKDDAGVVNETFKVVYTVDKETCELSFTRYGVDEHSNPEKVLFFVQDRVSMLTCSNIDMEITDMRIETLVMSFSEADIWKKKNKSFDARGGVLDTTVYLYGSGSRWGLLVVESKESRREKEVKMVTVAHYFVKSCGTSLHMSSGTNIGLSVVAKIGVSNGKFDIIVEGLEQHPVSALLYMFDEVFKTGIWKPSMCPHCHNKRRGKVFWQSESEDSDSVSIPVPRATPKNARGVSNGGKFKGNGNGNLFENNVMIFRKKR